MAEKRQEAESAEKEAAAGRRNGLAIRLCISVLLLAVAVVIRLEGGPRLQSAVAGTVEEDMTLTAVFAEIGRGIFGGEKEEPPESLPPESESKTVPESDA